MKRPLFLIVLLHLTFMKVNAQWLKVSPNTSFLNGFYTSVSYLSDSTGFFVGCSEPSAWNSIGLYKTTDRSSTWNNIKGASGGGCRLNNSFPDKNTGYCIITYGTNQPNDLMKTIDGGATWFRPDTTGNFRIGSLDFNGTLYFVNDLLGFLAKDDTLYKTANGGKSWNIVYLNKVVKDVFFTPNHVGYAAGDNIIMGTTDGGNSWIPLNTSYSIQSLYFPSNTVGYAVGAGGVILKTADMGNSWLPQISGISNTIGLRSVFCMNDNFCYAVGEKGTILNTSNGGASWVVQNSGVAVDLNDISCTSAQCVAVGDTSLILTTAVSTGIKTNSKTNEEMNAFPNPFYEATTIRIPAGLTQPFLIVYDALGRPVKRTGYIQGQEIKLYREDLLSGIYFARLHNSSGILSVHKLVVVD